MSHQPDVVRSDLTQSWWLAGGLAGVMAAAILFAFVPGGGSVVFLFPPIVLAVGPVGVVGGRFAWSVCHPAEKGPRWPCWVGRGLAGLGASLVLSAILTPWAGPIALLLFLPLELMLVPGFVFFGWAIEVVVKGRSHERLPAWVKGGLWGVVASWVGTVALFPVYPSAMTLFLFPVFEVALLPLGATVGAFVAMYDYEGGEAGWQS